MVETRAGNDALENAGARIRALLSEVLHGSDLAARVADDDSLREAGVSSPALMGLLARMEDEFGLEWDDDVDAGAVRSIASLSAYVTAVLGDGTAR